MPSSPTAGERPGSIFASRVHLSSRGAYSPGWDVQRRVQDRDRRGERLATFVVDIGDREATEALPGKVVDSLGSVDAVINVAGIIQPFVALNDLGHDDIDRVLRVDLYGTIHVVKAFLPVLLERTAAHPAVVSSMGAFLPVPGVDRRSQQFDGIEQDRFHIYVGRDARTMSLFRRVTPKRATHVIQRRMKGLLAG